MSSTPKMTLPTDSKARKDYPLYSGVLKYFPAALAGVAKISKQGNDKHNPGQPLHHARDKSMDHGDCILRHLTDTTDLLAAYDRNLNQEKCDPTTVDSEQILVEASQLAWRALALSQELHERFGAPLAPAAVLGSDVVVAPKQSLFTGFKIGDKVRIKQLTEVEQKQVNAAVTLMSEMKKHIGQIGEITHIYLDDRCVEVEINGDGWQWPTWALEPVE